MKINRSSRTSSSSVRRSSAKGRDGGGFRLSETSSGQATSAGSVGGTGPLAALEGLLALQAADSPDSYQGKHQQAVYRGTGLLDLLEEVRLGMMMGGIPKQKLDALVGLVERRRGLVQDKALEDILDEIELRARVEIAKMEMALK